MCFGASLSTFCLTQKEKTKTKQKYAKIFKNMPVESLAEIGHIFIQQAWALMEWEYSYGGHHHFGHS